jgi:hypothetical protein
MKKLIFAIAAIAALMLVSTVNGASKQEIWYAGVWCKTINKAVGCVKQNGKGYSVGFGTDVILVMHNGKNVFVRRNR